MGGSVTEVPGGLVAAAAAMAGDLGLVVRVVQTAVVTMDTLLPVLARESPLRYPGTAAAVAAAETAAAADSLEVPMPVQAGITIAAAETPRLSTAVVVAYGCGATPGGNGGSGTVIITQL